MSVKPEEVKRTATVRSIANGLIVDTNTTTTGGECGYRSKVVSHYATNMDEVKQIIEEFLK